MSTFQTKLQETMSKMGSKSPTMRTGIHGAAEDALAIPEHHAIEA